MTGTSITMTDQIPQRIAIHPMSTPVGLIHFATDEHDTLRALTFEDGRDHIGRLLARSYDTAAVNMSEEPGPVGAELQRYFDGDLGALARIRTASAGTPFQQAVWVALAEIPVGTTTSYGAIATTIGRPQAVRAVGMANGANPISIVVPCHRVIGTDGTMTGYGGGIERKRWLLAHEGVAVPRTLELGTSDLRLSLPNGMERGSPLRAHVEPQRSESRFGG